MNPATYSASEAAAVLGFSRAAVYLRADELRAIRLGRAVRFPRAFIDALSRGEVSLPTASQPEPERYVGPTIPPSSRARITRVR